MALTQCASCGSKISTKAEVCPKCKAAGPSSIPVVECPECGTSVSIDHQGPCHECGNPDIFPECEVADVSLYRNTRGDAAQEGSPEAVKNANERHPPEPDIEIDDFLKIVREGSVEEVSKVIRRRKDLLNESSKYGGTPLARAIANERSDLVELLLTAGADPNARDVRNETPLGCAISNCNYMSSALLLRHGANPFTHTYAGEFDCEMGPLKFATKLREKSNPNSFVLKTSLRVAAALGSSQSPDNLSYEDLLEKTREGYENLSKIVSLLERGSWDKVP